MNLNDMTRRFLLREEKSKSAMTYLQALKETIDSLRPRTQSDYRRIEIAKQHIAEVRKITRKLQERVILLEEQVKVLGEGRE